MPDRPEVLLLCYSFIAYLGLLLFDSFGLRHSDAAAYNSVSLFYGPGAYIGWYLVAVNALLRGPDSPKRDKQVDKPNCHNEDYLPEYGDGVQPEEHEEGRGHWEVNADLLGVFAYVGAALACSIFRIFFRNDAELEAGLVVMEAAADMSIVQVFTSTTGKYKRVVALVLLTFSFWCHNLPWVPKTQYQAPAVLTAVFLALGSVVWELHDKGLLPLKARARRRLIVVYFSALPVANGWGNYAVIPRTGERLISLDQVLMLDQLAALGLALVTILWSWRDRIEQALEPARAKFKTWNRGQSAGRVWWGTAS